MINSTDSKFGPIRSFLWPIYHHELKKLIPMLLMLFFICFNYTILRNMKDSIVVTAAGAEVIPFLKVWAVLPSAIVFTLLFTKLSNRFSQERVFYIMISGFLIFYALFAFLIYPLNNSLHPEHSADILETLLPAGFKGLISMYRHWTFTVFYVMAELWSTIIMSVSFWGFANEVTRIGEARRFYGVFGIGSNFAAIAGGQAALFFSHKDGAFNSNLPFGQSPWEQTMMSLILLIILSGIITIGLFYWLNRNVLADPSFDELHHNRQKKMIKSKKRLSLKESFAYLSNSNYLICIAILVVSYNLVINLGEVVWKDKLRQLYSSPSDYSHYVNELTSIGGIISTIFAFFMAKCIGKFGWTRTALVTPVTMLITSLGFFFFLVFNNNAEIGLLSLIGTTPLAIAVFFGSAQNCLSKAAKYSFFDTTKEMAFIPLDHETKLKGKAAIDGVGSRLGKSGGSLIHQGLLMVFATLTTSAPYVGAIMILVIILWIIATRSLGQKFNALVATQNQGVNPTLETETKTVASVIEEPKYKPLTG